jgi:DHA2 family multidrug resistance protein-like MFS transporter
MALGLVMGAGSSNRAAVRLGTPRVVAAGLTGVATLLALTLLWDPATSAGWLLAWFFAIALSMGWVMAPATDAVVGAVPAARSGVASAMNTVARMVSGALGVAVVGSLVNSLYSDDLTRSVGALPPAAQDAAKESVGGASALAAQLPPEAGARLASAAGDAFVGAMGVGLALAAALAVAAAVVSARLLPASASRAQSGAIERAAGGTEGAAPSPV